MKFGYHTSRGAFEMRPPEKNVGRFREAKDASQLLAGRMASLAMAWEAQRTLPRCGAKCRSTGFPCRNLALPNGKCRLHGGRTPKGKDWHKIQLANPGQSIERLEKKQREVARRREKLAERLQAMTPEERARYDAWHAARQPGGKSKRTKRRDDLTAKALLASAMRSDTAEAHAPEITRLADMIRQLEGAAAKLRNPSEDNDDQGGISA